MSNRLKNHFHELHVLKSCRPCQRIDYLKKSSPDLIKCICEICLNILNSNIKLKPEEKEKLKRYKYLLRYLAHKTGKKVKGEITNKREKIVQSGGFLPLILTPLLSIASELIVDLIKNEVHK